MNMRNSERGAALLMVLGGLALISALAAMALSVSTAPATRASAAIAQAEAERVAEAAIHRLIAALARDDLRRAAPLDGTVISTRFFDADVDISGQDMAGLVDLNHASQLVLRRLLTHSGSQSSAEIAAIWAGTRSAAAGRRPFLVPEDAIAALPIELRAEARAVLPHTTTWSGRAAIDPYIATAPTLAAVTGAPLADMQAFVAARTLDGRQVALPDTGEGGAAAFALSDGRVIRLSVRVTTPKGGRAAVNATVRVQRSARAPVAILSWR